MVNKSHYKNQKGGADLIDITKLTDASYIKRLDSANFDISSMLAPSGNRATYNAELLGLEENGSLYFPDIKITHSDLNSPEMLEIDELIKITNESEKARGLVADYLKEIQGSKFPESGDYAKVDLTNIGFKADGLAKEPSLLKKGVENVIELNKARGEYDIDCVTEVLNKKTETMWGSLESVLGWKYVNLKAFALFSPRQLGYLMAYVLDYEGSSGFNADHNNFIKQNFSIFGFADTIVNQLYRGVKLENDGLNTFSKQDNVKDANLSEIKDDKGKLKEGLFELLSKFDSAKRLVQFLQALFLFVIFKLFVPLNDKVKKAIKSNDKLAYRADVLEKQMNALIKYFSWVLASLFELDESKTNILKPINIETNHFKNIKEKLEEEFPIKITRDKKLNFEETAKGFYHLFLKYQPKSLPISGISMDNEVARCSIKFIKSYYTEMKSLFDKINKKSGKVREELAKKVPRDEIVKMRDMITNKLEKIAINPSADQRIIALQALINSLTQQYGIMRAEFHRLIRLNLLDTAHFTKSGIKEYTKEQQEKDIKQTQANLRSEALIVMSVALYKDFMARYNKGSGIVFPEEFVPIMLRSFGNEDKEIQIKILSLFKEKIQNREDKEAIATTVLRPINLSSIIQKNASGEEKMGQFTTLQTLKKSTPSAVNSSSGSSTSSSGTHAALAKVSSTPAAASSSSVNSSKIETIAKIVIKPEFWQAIYNKLEKKLYLPIFYNNQVGLLDVLKVGIDGKISGDPFPLAMSDYVIYFPVSSSEKVLKRTEEYVRNKGIILITDKMGNLGNMKNWMALSGKFYKENILKNKKNASLLRAHIFNLIVNANTYREEVGKPIGDSRISQMWAKYCSEYGSSLENCNILLAREPVVAFLGTIEKVDLKNNKLFLPYRMVSNLPSS